MLYLMVFLLQVRRRFFKFLIAFSVENFFLHQRFYRSKIYYDFKVFFF